MLVDCCILYIVIYACISAYYSQNVKTPKEYKKRSIFIRNILFSYFTKYQRINRNVYQDVISRKNIFFQNFTYTYKTFGEDLWYVYICILLFQHTLPLNIHY